MKKVKVITRHAIANYGSLLQSYATQKVFENLGYDSEIIDYVREEEQPEKLVDTYAKNSKFWNKNIITRWIYKMIQKPNLDKMNKVFEEYRKKYLKLTTKMYKNSQDLKEELPIADVYCTGSDQVWGKIANDDYDENYFLSFVPDDRKCIAYSASFGKTDISENLKKDLPQLMKKYKSIMVREQTAIDILNEIGINDVKLVLDPTLLLSREDWQIFLNEKYIPKEEYILVYQLHHNKNFDKYLKMIKKETKLKIYRISPSFYFSFKPGKLVYLPTLEEFITLFDNAKYVITDSFHGTVFSIIFNKQMIDILPKKTGTRIESILKLFEIDNRIIKKYDDLNIFNQEIKYENINKKLKDEQKKSIQALKDAIDIN